MSLKVTQAAYHCLLYPDVNVITISIHIHHLKRATRYYCQVLIGRDVFVVLPTGFGKRFVQLLFPWYIQWYGPIT